MTHTIIVVLAAWVTASLSLGLVWSLLTLNAERRRRSNR